MTGCVGSVSGTGYHLVNKVFTRRVISSLYTDYTRLHLTSVIVSAFLCTFLWVGGLGGQNYLYKGKYKPGRMSLCFVCETALVSVYVCLFNVFVCVCARAPEGTYMCACDCSCMCRYVCYACKRACCQTFHMT